MALAKSGSKHKLRDLIFENVESSVVILSKTFLVGVKALESNVDITVLSSRSGETRIGLSIYSLSILVKNLGSEHVKVSSWTGTVST